MQRLITPENRVVELHDDGTWRYAERPSRLFVRLQQLSIPADIVAQFQGLFRRLGIRVVDSDESLTCQLLDDGSVRFEEGVDPENVDVTVSIHYFQADRLAGCLERGELDDLEQFRIARELFRTAAAGAFQNLNSPLVTNPFLRRLISARNLVHVTLQSPDRAVEPDFESSFIFVNRRWLAIPGFYGEAQRKFALTVPDTLELQRKLFRGFSRNRWTEWFRIARWYLKWRRKVQVGPLRE